MPTRRSRKRKPTRRLCEWASRKVLTVSHRQEDSPTYRQGRPLTAYLQLESAGRAVAKTAEVTPSLLVDYDATETPLGLEILAFDESTLVRINEFLASIGKRVLTSRELAPLRAA